MLTKFRVPLLAALVLANIGAEAAAASEAPAGALSLPSGKQMLATLRPGHPRLLSSREEFVRLKDISSSREPLRGWRESLAREADQLLAASPSQYEIPDGLRLLSTSRRVLRRMQTLGLQYQLSGQSKYAERAWLELRAAAAFPDWNPRHFLDTAEMTHAFAIAYDWLWEFWTPEQKGLIRQAIIDKGLKPALEVYTGKGRFGSWHKARHNWNQVCNGGIGIGALALADEEPELAGALLENAVKTIQLAMAEFAPDGAWAEGPGYWNYATTYNVVFLAALETALGTDFGLSTIPGFEQAGLFPIYLTGPSGRTFNYADGSDATIRAPQLFWLAKRFQQPAYANFQISHSTAHPLDLIWFAETGQPNIALPLDRYFREAEIVCWRSSWSDPEALFVGFKAGDNKANHSHLDLGAFVLEALGVRWAVDLGADDYNLPGYFGKQRWSYYRLRAEGHNTLVINPSSTPDQDPSARARIVKHRSQSDRSIAVADLSAAYSAHVKSAQRGFALLNKRRLLVQDEIDAPAPCNISWFMHTPAQIEMESSGRRALLRQSGKTFQAQLLAPAEAKFVVKEAAPALPLVQATSTPDRQAKNNGIRKLTVHLPATSQARLAILLGPAEEASDQTPITPLNTW